MDDSGSSDSDGSIVGFNWEQIGDSPQALSIGEKTDTSSFTTPAVSVSTALTFEFEVTNTDHVTVKVTNTP